MNFWATYFILLTNFCRVVSDPPILRKRGYIYIYLYLYKNSQSSIKEEVTISATVVQNACFHFQQWKVFCSRPADQYLKGWVFLVHTYTPPINVFFLSFHGIVLLFMFSSWKSCCYKRIQLGGGQADTGVWSICAMPRWLPACLPPNIFNLQGRILTLFSHSWQSYPWSFLPQYFAS